MDLDLILADMSGRFDAERRLVGEAIIAELTDAERAGVTLAARLFACHGVNVTVLVRGGLRLDGVLVDAARTWILLEVDSDQVLIPLAAIAAVWPLAGAAVDESSVARGVAIGHVLREISARHGVVIIDHDAGCHQGRVEAVFADHVDIAASNQVVDMRDRTVSQIISLPIVGIRTLRVAHDSWG